MRRRVMNLAAYAVKCAPRGQIHYVSVVRYHSDFSLKRKGKMVGYDSFGAIYWNKVKWLMGDT